MEREGAQAQRVEMDAQLIERPEGFLHRQRARTEIDRADAGRLAGLALLWARHQALGGLELAQEPLHVVDVVRPLLGIMRVAVLGGAAGKEGAARWMGAGQRAVRDAVAIDIEIAAELLAGFE